MPVAQTTAVGSATSLSPSAVAWINGHEAIVARLGSDGRESTSEISRGSLPERSFLALVVRAIGDRQRLLILGPSSARLALEREYASIFRGPGRLVDVEASGPVEVNGLAERLRTLASGRASLEHARMTGHIESPGRGIARLTHDLEVLTLPLGILLVLLILCLFTATWSAAL
jgi:hypothetical protein